MTQQVDAVVSDEIVGDTYVVRKKVDELSLDEIKTELEKRNLDYSGDDYAILHERLTDSMIEEGLEPATFEFELEADEEEDEEEDDPVVREHEGKDDLEEPATAIPLISQSKEPAAAIATGAAVSATGPCMTAGPAGKKDDNKKCPPAEGEQPQYEEVPGNHIWVSGLSSRCKAADLKKFFTRYANVGSAKIVANARTNSAHCYGYITVESLSDLQKCVEKLHCTRFEGNFIEVEVCKLAPADQLRKVEMKNRERLAQQKEEFRKRKADRRQKLEEENNKREEARRQEESKRKEFEKKRGDIDTHKARELKKDFRKEERRMVPDRRRSRSPNSRRRSDLILRRLGAGPPPMRRFGRSDYPRRGSPPYGRGHLRTRSPSPFGHTGPAPFLHGPPSMIERSSLRMIDRRLEEERLEVERRQRAETEALEREKRQLRLERERLEREKLDLIRRLERERVKKELEEAAARKEVAERRRQEELHRQQQHQQQQQHQHQHQQQQQQQEEERKRDEVRFDIERRPRDTVRQSAPLVTHVDSSMEIFDPRVPLTEDYARGQIDIKFGGHLVPALQREQPVIRHDDRRRDERRRELPAVSSPRIERRLPAYMEPWGGHDLKARVDYLDPQLNDSLPPKRQRSRSPLPRSNGGGGGGGGGGGIGAGGGFNQLTSQDYGRPMPMSGTDSWRASGQQSMSNANAYLDGRRAPALTSRPMDLMQSNSHWTSPARVAFPPAYGQQETSRGFLGGSSSSGFGLPSLSGYRRY